MGRDPNWHPPRHLAADRRPGTDAREHQVAEWLLATVAIVLTMVVLVGQMVGRPDPPGPGAAPDPRAPPAATGQPAADPPSAGWLAIGGARVERTGPALAGRWAGGFTAGGRGDQGMVLPGVARCTPGRTYAADVWVRASRPGTLVQVTLLEVAGGRRLAADTVGAALQQGQWQRVEVAHDAHRAGAALAVEVVLPAGSPPATVLVDDLEVVAHRAPFMSAG